MIDSGVLLNLSYDVIAFDKLFSFLKNLNKIQFLQIFISCPSNLNSVIE